MNKTERQNVYSHFFHTTEPWFLSVELLAPMSLDTLTTSRLFDRPGIHIYTHSEFKLHTVLTTAVLGNSDELRPQRFLII
jgi:hypothetical protein